MTSPVPWTGVLSKKQRPFEQFADKPHISADKTKSKNGAPKKKKKNHLFFSNYANYVIRIIVNE
jgi:hypothetical protein